jgi:hypothetical protein
MDVRMCGPNPPAEGDLKIVDAFARYLKDEISLDEFDAECARIDGIDPTQEGSTDANRREGR